MAADDTEDFCEPGLTPGTIHWVDNGHGTEIAIKRVRVGTVRPGTRPVLIVPGYGMNSFIFGYHPSGLSLEAYLATEGLEVFSVDLRGQGRARSRGPIQDFGLGELAIDDLSRAVEFVRAHTTTGQSKVDLVGCSLGATLVFTYLASTPAAPIGTVVSLGGLVTWRAVPPLVTALFVSPWLASMVRLRHTRRLAGTVFPPLARFAPRLLRLYMNVDTTDTSNPATMIRTVEDPNPRINRQIAEWTHRRELVVRGVNVSRAMPTLRYPTLCLLARHDGIVPVETGRAVFDEVGAADKELVIVGDAGKRVAHADMFIGRGMQDEVFAPMSRFLIRRA